jgi:hypothetical protein
MLVCAQGIAAITNVTPDKPTKGERSMPKDTPDVKIPEVWRMVIPDHVCPFGLKSVDLLKRQDYDVEDHPSEDPSANGSVSEKT